MKSYADELITNIRSYLSQEKQSLANKMALGQAIDDYAGYQNQVGFYTGLLRAETLVARVIRELQDEDDQLEEVEEKEE